MRNIVVKTGKDLDSWISILKEGQFNKHNDIVDFLKSNYSITHGYANLIARRFIDNHGKKV